jgi:hypothetical protein
MKNVILKPDVDKKKTPEGAFLANVRKELAEYRASDAFIQDSIASDQDLYFDQRYKKNIAWKLSNDLCQVC